MLYKRPDSPYWWCRFTIRGHRVRCSTETRSRREAELFEARQRAKLWKRIKLGEHPFTFEDVALRWLQDRDGKRSLNRDAGIIAWLRPRLKDKLLSEIDRETIEELRRDRAKESSKSNVNREMALLRAMLRAARDDWEWIDQIPKVPMYELEKGEPRFLTRAEFERLASHMPTHLERIARFAVNTGLRRANVLGLQWSQLDAERRFARIPALRSKSKVTLTVPVNAEARGVLAACQEGNESDFVFLYEGEPVTTIKRSWATAVKAAKLSPLRFHDLRHTWATWVAQAGVDLQTLQAAGGWSDYRMVKVYAHSQPEHVLAAVEKIAANGDE